MEETRIWKGLGVVETIHEVADEDESSTNLSVSPDQTSSTTLNSRVQAWSLATGKSANVVINVHNSRFVLHKEPLTMRSGYLRRHLKGISELVLSPALMISAETFSLVAEFCYGVNLVLTPLNIAPLRVASELLDMTEEPDDDALCENLSKETEDYFRHAISLNREYATLVFRSSLSLLPEAETTARLVSRCIVALTLMGDDNGIMKCLADVKVVDLCPDDFELIVESLNHRLTCSHDILYKIIDHYLKEYGGKLSEEQKGRICNYIDCASLSPQLLMHAVQNPGMPLRFIVQAMFVEQINTRRSVLCAADRNNNYTKHHPLNNNSNAVTLGAILQRDSALREVAHLKAAMNVTTSRIQSVEKELSSMREIVLNSDNSLDSGRSMSFRLASENNKVERGQVGSMSLGNFGFFSRKDRGGGIMSPLKSCDGESTPRVEKRYGRRLVNGVKSAFKLPSFLSSKKRMAVERGSFLNKDEKRKVEDKDVLVLKKDLPFEKHSS